MIFHDSMLPKLQDHTQNLVSYLVTQWLVLQIGVHQCNPITE